MVVLGIVEEVIAALYRLLQANAHADPPLKPTYLELYEDVVADIVDWLSQGKPLGLGARLSLNNRIHLHRDIAGMRFPGEEAASTLLLRHLEDLNNRLYLTGYPQLAQASHEALSLTPDGLAVELRLLPQRQRCLRLQPQHHPLQMRKLVRLVVVAQQPREIVVGSRRKCRHDSAAGEVVEKLNARSRL